MTPSLCDRRFGTWPIAVLSKARKRVLLQGPLCNGSQVIGWHSNQRSRVPRRFHIGLSGFAFNSTILWDPKRWRRPTFENIRIHSAGKEGSQVSLFALCAPVVGSLRPTVLINGTHFQVNSVNVLGYKLINEGNAKLLTDSNRIV